MSGTHNPSVESGEDLLIARHFKPLATDPGAFGLVDDAAVLTPPPGFDLVLKADAIVSGIHFFPDDAPATVAKKALRVNLSDLAAKGAAPRGFLLSLALPKGIDDDWLAGFAAGLGEDARDFGCPLFGGDTVRSPDAIMIAISVIGLVPHGRMVKRSGARPGDILTVTGTIGDAALGLILRRDSGAAARWGLSAAERAHLLDRYLLPRPRSAAAPVLLACASGGMDVSDGLLGDLGKLCRASEVSVDFDAANVPLSDAARKALAAKPALIESILTGGDDFEVLASVGEAAWEKLRTQALAAGVTMTAIGRCRDVAAGGAGVTVRKNGVPLSFARASFSHF